MSEDSIKTSLLKLREQIESADKLDDETLAIAQNLEADIQKRLDENAPENFNSSVDLATSLETRFEAEHPTAAAVVRELISVLQKMGI